MSDTKARKPDFWPADRPWTFDIPDHPIDANLETTATRWPDRTALVFQGREITYAALWNHVQAFAGWLQTEAQLEKGDRVLLFTQNSPHYIIAFYGILRAGGAVVPVNPMNRTAEVDYLVSDTGARVAVCGLELAEHILPALQRGDLTHLVGGRYDDMVLPGFDLTAPLPPAMTETEAATHGVTGFSAVLSAGHTPTPRTHGLDDLSVIPYSSGTTGQPKGCVHTHRTVMSSLVAGLLWNPVDENTVHLGALPFFHVTGMMNAMHGPIMTGGKNVILPRWSSRLAAGLIERYRIQRWRSISTMVIDLVNDPEFDSYDLSSLVMIGGGGAAMPAAIAKRLKDMLGLDYVEGYGLSETMAATHVNPLDAPRPQCLGQPVFEVDSRVLETGGTAELPHGEVGEIVIHAPQNFIGYWQRPEETEKAFVTLDGLPFLRSGDIGYRDAEGYFYMVDRVKRMVNVSGFKVWPAEIEMLMLHHPDIAEACVIGANDPRRGEVVKAVVVPRASARDTLTEEAVIAWCRGEMAAYKCPRIVEFTDALPKSGAGKVLWKELT